MSSRLDSRVQSLERQWGDAEPCCNDVAYQGDPDQPYAPQPTPLCPHGRPWRRITVYYHEAGDRDERA